MGRHTLIDVLTEIFIKPRALQSNFSREHSHEIARLASVGLITTAFKGTFGNHWRCNVKGLRVLDLGDDQ